MKLAYSMLLFIFATIVGGYWDIWTHQGTVETFFTPPHMLINLSIIMGGVVPTVYLWIKRREFVSLENWKEKGWGLSLLLSSSFLQLMSSVFDYTFHRVVGFDLTVWSPPHLLAIFSIILQSIAVFYLFLEKRNILGSILALSSGIMVMQYAIFEYELDIYNLWGETWVLENRWTDGYWYGILFIPVVLLLIHFGEKHFNKSLATVIIFPAYLFKWIIFGAWESTGYLLYEPLLMIVPGLLYDAMSYLTKTKWIKLFVFSVSMNIMIAIQSPLEWSFDFLILGTLASYIVTICYIHPKEIKKWKKTVLNVGTMIALFMPVTVYAHGEDIITKIAPDMKPHWVLFELTLIFIMGYYLARFIYQFEKRPK